MTTGPTSIGNDRCRSTSHHDDGGRVAQITVDDIALLVGQAEAHEPSPLAWGSYPMVPWAGRIRHGRFRFDDEAVRAPGELRRPRDPRRRLRHAVDGDTTRSRCDRARAGDAERHPLAVRRHRPPAHRRRRCRRCGASWPRKPASRRCRPHSAGTRGSASRPSFDFHPGRCSAATTTTSPSTSSSPFRRGRGTTASSTRSRSPSRSTVSTCSWPRIAGTGSSTTCQLTPPVSSRRAPRPTRSTCARTGSSLARACRSGSRSASLPSR